MSAVDLQQRIARHLEHARAAHVLDEELGTLHGIGWADFVLLDVLESAGNMAAHEIASRLGMSRSRLLLQVLPLEKLGLVDRQAAPGIGARRVALRAPGRRLLREARETAAALSSSLSRAA